MLWSKVFGGDNENDDEDYFSKSFYFDEENEDEEENDDDDDDEKIDITSLKKIPRHDQAPTFPQNHLSPTHPRSLFFKFHCLFFHLQRRHRGKEVWKMT